MRTVRIYQTGTYSCGDIIELSPSASQHVGVVLRMQPGQSLTLFCGDNQEYQATIESVMKKRVTVYIHEVHAVNRESPCAIHLAQGIAKGDRMEWIVQKAVELGVSSISPLLTQHGAIKHDTDKLLKKQAQWQAIAIGACEQSGRNIIPVIHAPCSFQHYMQHCQTSNRWLLDPHTTLSWRQQLHAATEITLLIGPEGGFHHDEVDAAHQAGFHALSLGPRVLRTETAALAALSVLQAFVGDL
jgi:16S rRNA (uracil1498-N3)-methyltransferase